jgi:hypothetical protein
MTTETTTTIRYTIWISNGGEIDDYGRLAAVAVSHIAGPDGWELDDSGVFIAAADDVQALDEMTGAEINAAAMPLVEQAQAWLATRYQVPADGWDWHNRDVQDQYAATRREWTIEVAR